MKIGLYTPNYPEITGEGGIGTYTRQLARGLSSLGHAVHVLTPSDRSDAVKDGEITVHFSSTAHLPVMDRIIPGAGGMLRINRAAQRLASQHHIDVFEFANWDGLGSLFAHLRRVPLVVRLHTSSAETQKIDNVQRSRNSMWDHRREYIQAHKADVLLTHSLAHRKLMSEELGVAETTIRVVPHGIDNYSTSTSNLGHHHDVSVVPTVLFVGRMEARKGTLDLIKAAPLVLKKVPNVRFILVGKDRPHCPGSRTHAQFIKDELPKNVATHITLTGRLSDQEVDHWMHSATLFVAPSLYESFGLVFLEAMRWGTPVIGTNVGGIPEIIENRKSGMLVPPSDPSALADAIVELLCNNEMRRSIGLTGQQRVSTHFTLDRMVRQTLDVYTEAIDKWKAK